LKLANGEKMDKEELSTISLRPYQLLCILCSFGEENPNLKDEKIKKVFEAIGENPDIPISLRCNAGDVYIYQDPGTEEDTAEGSEYNRKRDLDILQRLDMAPGDTLPARTLLLRLIKMVPTVSGICGYGTTTSEAWRGCQKAKSGYYEKGREIGITAIIPPRSEEEMAMEKERSLAVMYSAKEITVRPHILLCAVCQYGGGTRPPFKPDNLPEFIEMILTKKPDIPVKMAKQADWLMCAPCPALVPKLNACVNVLGSGGLSNEKRDLDTLQRLGLTYGSVMPATKLYQLIFERIPTTQNICKRENNHTPSVWWDGCGEANCEKGNENYEKGREELMEKLTHMGDRQNPHSYRHT
jgi:hypothetical protein